MRSLTHPLSGAVYDLLEDGVIEVSKNGRTGRFSAHGLHLSGELRQADPHLCLWIAGPQLPNRFQQAAATVAQSSPKESS
jgi:hypothetical protein